MRVFLTGATGLIGTGVSKALVEAGHTVYALCRSRSAATELRHSGISPVIGDLRQVYDWIWAMPPVDGVIHAAATFTSDMAEVDAHFVSALLAWAAKSRPHRINPIHVVYTGGVWLYGSRGDTPIRERDGFLPPETFAFLLDGRRRLFQAEVLTASVIHPASVWCWADGAVREFHHDAVSRLPPKVIDTGANRWPLIHTADLADSYVRVVAHGKHGVDYHGVQDPGRRSLEVANLVAGYFDAPNPELISVDDGVQIYGDAAYNQLYDQIMCATQTREELSWQPQITLEDLYGRLDC